MKNLSADFAARNPFTAKLPATVVVDPGMIFCPDGKPARELAYCFEIVNTSICLLIIFNFYCYSWKDRSIAESWSVCFWRSLGARGNEGRGLLFLIPSAGD